MLVAVRAVDVVVVGSVAALTPKAEIEARWRSAHGLAGAAHVQALRKLTRQHQSDRTIVIFINQIRMKIGVYVRNPETTTAATS